MLGIAALVAAVAVAGVLVAPRVRLSRAEASVREALQGARYTEFRVTDCDYAPYSAATPASPALDAALRDLEGLAAGRDVRVVHAYGRALLIAGRAGDAVRVLRIAALGETPDAGILADLAAAQADAGDLVGAHTLVERALGVDPGRPEALFDRGIIQAKLGNPGLARDDFNRYLAADRDSPWAAEAREWLSRLNPRL